MKTKLLFTLISVLLLGSCKTAYKFRVYDRYPEINEIENGRVPTRKAIVLGNDSVLNYHVTWGGIGSRADIRYRIVDNMIMVDSISLNGKIPPKIFNAHFLLGRDSLVNIETQEVYYYEKYWFNKRRSKFVRHKNQWELPN